MIFLYFLFAFIFLRTPLFAVAQDVVETIETAPATRTDAPTYISLADNINDFGRFADGGPDGNWYVGFNNAWIVELPPIPRAEFTHAFIGAKLGRAKTVPKADVPWERESIPGKVYMAVSQNPSFPSDRSFFLVDTLDIPTEVDSKVYLPDTGQSQWFWAEVPLNLISATKPNFLIVWSPSDALKDSASSPILAALESRGEAKLNGTHAWLNRSILGVPPRKISPALALETPINNLYPALAIKMVPPNQNNVTVRACEASTTGRNAVFSFTVRGLDTELSWIEISNDQLDWERFSKYLRQPPFIITLPMDELPARGAYLRAVARDILGNEGACGALYISNTRHP